MDTKCAASPGSKRNLLKFYLFTKQFSGVIYMSFWSNFYMSASSINFPLYCSCKPCGGKFNRFVCILLLKFLVIWMVLLRNKTSCNWLWLELKEKRKKKGKIYLWTRMACCSPFVNKDITNMHNYSIIFVFNCEMLRRAGVYVWVKQ